MDTSASFRYLSLQEAEGSSGSTPASRPASTTASRKPLPKSLGVTKPGSAMARNAELARRRAEEARRSSLASARKASAQAEAASAKAKSEAARQTQKAKLDAAVKISQSSGNRMMG